MSDEEEGFFQLTNYKTHPENNMYRVFFFVEKERADYFENLLKEKEISFEVDEDVHKGNPIYYYGVHKRDMKETLNCNFLTVGAFRKPLLGANKWVRYIMVVFFLMFLALAIVGWAMSD